MASFRTLETARESLKNLASRPVLLILSVVIIAALGFTAMRMTGDEFQRILDYSDQLTERGQHAVTVSAPDGIPAGRCEALGEIEGINAAGGRVSSNSDQILAPGMEQVRVKSVTPGFISVMWPGLSARPGLLFGAEAAERAGVAEGSRVLLASDAPNSPQRVGAVLPRTARDVDLAQSIIRVVPPTGLVTQCVVDVEPGARIGAIAVITSGLQDLDAHVSPLFAPDPGIPSPQQQLDSRLSLYLPAAAAAVSGFILLALWILRSKDFALYRLLKMGRGKLSLALAVEYVAVVGVPLVFGGMAAVVTAPWNPSGRLTEALMLAFAQMAVITFPLAAVGAFMLSLRPASRIILSEG